MKLQVKASLFLSALLLVVLLSLGGLLSYFLDKSLRNEANQDLLQEAVQVGNRLDAFILNSQTDLINITQHMNIQALLEGKLGKIETYLETVFSANSRFDNGFFILDAQGILVVDYPVSEIRGIKLAFREYFKRTSSDKKPIISSAYHSKRTGAMVITFTVPLLSHQGNFLGLFAGSVNLLQYAFAGNLRDFQIGQTGKIMVYDSKGKIIYYPDRDLTTQEGGPPQADPLLRGLPQGSKGLIDRQAADGKEYSMAFHPLQNIDWMVAVLLQKEEILAPLNSLKKQIALFLLVALVLAVGIGIRVIGILAKPIKAFSNSIKQYKGGDWEEPAGLISRRDELGELGKSFKSMTSQLSETLNSLTESETKYRALVHGSMVGVFLIQRRLFVFVNPRFAEIFGYSQEELVSSFDSLELVAPRDRDRVLKNMTRPRSENDRLVHFFWQGLQKDGSLIEVEVMGTLMLYQGKPAIHGTLLDITERQRAEEAFRESEKKYRLIADNSNDWIYLIRLDGKFQYVSPSSERLTGYPSVEFINNPDLFLNIIHPDDQGLVKSHLEEVREETQAHNLEFRLITKEGELRWLRHSCLPIYNDQVQYVGRSGTNRDITRRKLLERKHAQLNQVREELIPSKTLGEKLKIITAGLVHIFEADFARIWVVKPGDRCAECRHAQIKEGPHVCRYQDQCLHLTASSGRYTHLDGEIHRRVPYGCYKIGLVASGAIPGFVTNEVAQDPRVHNPDWAQELGLVSFAGYRLLSAEGESIGIMALFSRQVISSDDDVLLKGLANSTAQVIQTVKMEETLRESEERYRTAIEQSNDGIALVREDRHIFVNQKMAEIFGYDRPEEIIGQPVAMLIHPDDQDRVIDINRRRLRGESVSEKYEFKGQRKNGEPIPIEVSAAKTTYQGEVISLVYLRDITDRRRAEEALKALSVKDDLTGLYNRRGFFTLAEQGLKTAQRMGTALVLIFGDLDNLKGINDTFGHKEGDQALMDIAQILKETFREADIIARLGGDEFVILAMDGFEASPEKMITRLERVLNDHHLQTKRPYTLSLSLGISCFSPKNPCSIEVLLAEADKLMYENKQKKRRP